MSENISQPNKNDPPVPESIGETGDFIDFELTAEEQAKQEEYRRRRDIAAIPVEEYFNFRDMDTTYVPPHIRDLPEDQRKQNLVRMHHNATGRVMHDVAYGPVPAEDIDGWARTITQTAATLTSDRDPSVVAGVSRAAESLELAQYFNGLAKSWHDEFLIDVPHDVAMKRIADFNETVVELSGVNRMPRPELSRQEFSAIFEEMIYVYKDVYSKTPNNSEQEKFLSQHPRMAVQNAMLWKDPQQARHLTEIFDNVWNRVDDPMAARYYDTARSYAANHKLDGQTTDALNDNVLPRMMARNPEVEVLLKPGNVNGMRQGDFGIADFICHSLTREATPANFNELFMVLREVPTTEASRLESNRQDALRLASTFRILRDFIHDQRPHVHEMLEEMVNYYDTHDSTKVTAVMDKTDYFAPANTAYRDAILDLSGYDKAIESRDESKPEPELSIEIVRRLERNTRPVDEQPPNSDDPVFNDMLARVTEPSVGWEDKHREGVLTATRYANDRLSNMVENRTIGVEPNFVKVLVWLEQQQFNALQGIGYEDQLGLAKAPWFQEILRFHELTHNTEYDAEEFTQFLETLQAESNAAAAKSVLYRVLGQIEPLAQHYRNIGKNDWVEALWSGNTTHELTGLADPRPARTRAGERVKKQRESAVHPF